MLNSLLLTETCKFKLSPNEEHKTILDELFSTYENAVRECLNKAITMNITSRRRLHEAVYKGLRSRHPTHPSHYIYTAITQALAIFKSYRRMSRKRKDVKRPSIESLNVILLDDTHLFRFNWGSLKLATHKGHIVIPFEVHEHSKKFMDWQVKGSRLVKRNGEYCLHVTFRRIIEEKSPEGVLGVDINERSVDLAVVKPDKVRFMKIDVSKAKYIRDRYFRRRRSIQGKTLGKTKVALLTKYSGRERRRINNILHTASKIISQIVKEENVKPVMEKLTNIRERIQYGRKMNRRLHSMPFRKLQNYIFYKSMEQGFKPEVADARNTSKTCPICSELNKLNGQVYVCRRCGFQADRHLVAAWNIAMKHPMCRPLPLAAKALNEPLAIEVKGKG